MPDKHAFLSASGSARACENIPDAQTEFTMEGTDAHKLCEYKLRKYLGQNTTDPRENLTYYNKETEEYTDEYLQYITECVESEKQKGGKPQVLVEQKLDFSKYVPEGFGTGDCIIYTKPKLHVIDFKYGVGVPVKAEQNTQMMCYALGAVGIFSDVETIEMTIFQPRISNISTWETTKSELLDWAENTLKPRAKLAWNGEGDFHSGKHCRFCKIKANCRKRAEEMPKYDSREPSTLNISEIEDILDRADEVISYLHDVKSFALAEILDGKPYERYTVKENTQTKNKLPKSSQMRDMTRM